MPVEGEYEPSAQGWVRDQVELYEGSGGTQGTTLRETGLPVVIVTMRYFMFDHPAMAWDPRFAASSAL